MMLDHGLETRREPRDLDGVPKPVFATEPGPRHRIRELRDEYEARLGDCRKRRNADQPPEPNLVAQLREVSR